MKNTFLIILLAISFSMQAQDVFKNIEQTEGIAVGTKVSDFAAMEADGTSFMLSEALKEGPVVLLFYRGQWCPVCSKHLSNLQDSLDYIQEAGGRLVAVSPEKQENLQKTKTKTNASFSLLFDEDYKICDAFGVTFLPDGKTRTAYNSMLGASLKSAHSDDSQRLPVPATYIIGQDGVVKWRHFDQSYKVRASPAQIIQALDNL